MLLNLRQRLQYLHMGHAALNCPRLLCWCSRCPVLPYSGLYVNWSFCAKDYSPSKAFKGLFVVEAFTDQNQPTLSKHLR